MSFISKIIKKRSLKLFLKKLYFNTKRRPNRNQKKWFTEDGDNTYRLDYSLDSNSIFFEVGGYKGYYAKKIYNKFKPKTYIFEPDLNFTKLLFKEFENRDDVTIVEKALGSKTGKFFLIEKGDSSFIGKGLEPNSDSKQIEMISFKDFVSYQNINSIDLLSMNIEGGEYELLEHMIDEGLHLIVKNLQIQFHKNVKNHSKLKKKITASLQSSHQLEWSFDYVWENWKLFK